MSCCRGFSFNFSTCCVFGHTFVFKTILYVALLSSVALLTWFHSFSVGGNFPPRNNASVSHTPLPFSVVYNLLLVYNTTYCTTERLHSERSRFVRTYVRTYFHSFILFIVAQKKENSATSNLPRRKEMENPS